MTGWDIYKYIVHLLALPDKTFTTNQLSNYAKTGSSSSNYIGEMSKMGLIVRTDMKKGGGTVYQIADPKIIYALENKIRIVRKDV